MHKENCFITLTYDNEHLPKAHCHVGSKKECQEGSLCAEEFQLFVKRLRKCVGVRLRYYHAGEYGEKFQRPHYHALIFGYDFPDRRVLKTTGSGATIYTSAMLSRVWQKGYASVGDVTFESAAYVARYCLKKVTGRGKDIVDESTGLRPYDRVVAGTGEVVSVRPEYVTMSRRPGIAKAWYERYRSDVFPHGYCVVREGVKMPPPRYYDGLYELDNAVDMDRIKKLRCSRNTRREIVWSDVLQKYQLLDVNRDDRLAVMECCKAKDISELRKKLESGQ